MDRKNFINKCIGLLAFGGFTLTGLAVQPGKKEAKYKIITQRCDGCGHCYRACKQKAINPEGRSAKIDPTKCEGCGDCQRFCRRMAIVPDETKTQTK